jgi:endonuclease YncB( thermonuclease family)
LLPTRAVVLAVALTLAHPVAAKPRPEPAVEVQVVGVLDGDTVKVLLDGLEQKVRLTEIDAPEKKQAFGQKSKETLLALCIGQPAKLVVSGKDRYSRLLGRLSCGGKDANAEQVRQGLAWVYDQYVTDRSLYDLQAAAQQAKRGLWTDPAPVPPWQWRRSRRGGQ